MSSLLSKKISFIIPAYNEEKDIERTLAGQINECANLNIELIVVDDGSTDDTMGVALKFFAKSQHGFVLSSGHCGRGSALCQGIMAATGDILILTAADIILKRKIIEELMGFNHTHDLILLSKNLPDSKVIGRSFTRAILSKIFNWMVRIMFNLHFRDTQGIKIGNRERLKDVLKFCDNKGFILDLEMVVYASKLGYSIVELPWELVFRAGSKTVIKNIHKILFQLLELRIKTSFFNFNKSYKKHYKIPVKQLIKDIN
jgi:dolichol-phosphate mannosyltransferase